LFLGPLAGIFIAGLLKASLILFIIDPFFPFLGNLLSLFMEKTAWTSDLILSLAGKNQFFRITLPTIEPDLIFLLILLTAFSMVLARKFHEFLKQNLEKLMKY
jgi:positive regulator of sigma E activity